MRARLTLFGPRAGFAALLVVAAAVPTLFWRQATEAFMVPKVTLLYLCVIVVLAGITMWAVAARANPFPPVHAALPYGVLVVLTAAATVFSIAPTTSFLGQYARYDGLLMLVIGGVLAAAVVATTWRSPQRLERVVQAVLVGGALSLGYVTIQWFKLDWVEWLDETGGRIVRPYGTLGNSNFSGAHLAIVVPFVLAYRARLTRPLYQWLLLGAAAYLVLGVWWTGTRGGALAAVAGVAAAGFLAPEAVPKVLKWGAAAATVAGLGIVLLAAGGDKVPGTGLLPETRFLYAGTLETRVDIWKAGVDMVAEDPLLGTGPDTFGVRYPDLRRPTRVDYPATNADEAHNVYLDRAATSGLPATLAYLWLLGTVGWSAWKRRDRVAPEHRWLLASFGGGLAAYAFQGLVSIDVVPLVVLAWLCIGALVSLTDRSVVARRDEDPDPAPALLRPLPIGVLVGVLAGVVLLGALAVRPLLADLAFRDGIESTGRDEPLAQGAKDFQRATEWNPTEPTYQVRFADQLVLIARDEAPDDAFRTRLLNEALLGYDQALEQAPGDMVALRAKARAQVALAAVDGPQHLLVAERMYRDLLADVDTDDQLFAETAAVLLQRLDTAPPDDPAEVQALTDEATELYEKSLALYSRSVPVLGQLARLYVADRRYAEARDLLERAVALAPDRDDLAEALAVVEKAIADQE